MCQSSPGTGQDASVRSSSRSVSSIWDNCTATTQPRLSGGLDPDSGASVARAEQVLQEAGPTSFCSLRAVVPASHLDARPTCSPAWAARQRAWHFKLSDFAIAARRWWQGGCWGQALESATSRPEAPGAKLLCVRPLNCKFDRRGQPACRRTSFRRACIEQQQPAARQKEIPGPDGRGQAAAVQGVHLPLLEPWAGQAGPQPQQRSRAHLRRCARTLLRARAMSDWA